MNTNKIKNFLGWWGYVVLWKNYILVLIWLSVLITVMPLGWPQRLIPTVTLLIVYFLPRIIIRLQIHKSNLFLIALAEHVIENIPMSEYEGWRGILGPTTDLRNGIKKTLITRDGKNLWFLVRFHKNKKDLIHFF